MAWLCCLHQRWHCPHQNFRHHHCCFRSGVDHHHLHHLQEFPHYHRCCHRLHQHHHWCHFFQSMVGQFSHLQSKCFLPCHSLCHLCWLFPCLRLQQNHYQHHQYQNYHHPH